MLWGTGAPGGAFLAPRRNGYLEVVGLLTSESSLPRPPFPVVPVGGAMSGAGGVGSSSVTVAGAVSVSHRLPVTTLEHFDKEQPGDCQGSPSGSQEREGRFEVRVRDPGRVARNASPGRLPPGDPATALRPGTSHLLPRSSQLEPRTPSQIDTSPTLRLTSILHGSL